MQTIRQQMIQLLSQQKMSAKELSRTVKVREKEVYEHLAHIARSAKTRRQKLVMMPSRCLQCGYVFKDRKRFTPPSRCPRCKNEHIQHPAYSIV